ncbi:MAG: thioredoxin [Ruminococcus sp.]|nr:thioredoxin [Ruminococcus sp.]MCD7799626.1 thioredoxin [Ruminococcus sp.]
MIINITKENFENEVLKSDKKVLLDFWATWCMPCTMLSPIVDEVSEEINTVKFGKVNVDEQGELAQTFGISSIPALIVIENGKVVNQSVGLIPKNQILQLIGN